MGGEQRWSRFPPERRGTHHGEVRCCWCSVDTTVSMLSTNREPAALCVPKRPLRHNTPGRIARSAALVVGSTPATCTKVHNAWRRFRMSRHVPAVLGPPQRLPTPKSRSTSRRRGVRSVRNVERWKVPVRTRCHHVNLCYACTNRASPSAVDTPPRSRLASQARSRGAQHSGRHRTGYQW